ncbi:hypothetical protein Acr_13g0006130 [Actinidia rufa]|uniref:Uncharacterized protein n=1 Tax=Actinidia rufa TaxID=165716 RepID=A0A7J0FKI9_9ERIC|nr:hypothetical protein Acr_13g0006130 [Actinidia rufa]
MVVQVVSATSALPEETKLEQPIKDEETTLEDVVTCRQWWSHQQKRRKKQRQPSHQRNYRWLRNLKPPVADVETEVVVEEAEVVAEELVAGKKAPVVGPELVTEAPEEEVGGGEEKPAQAEEEGLGSRHMHRTHSDLPMTAYIVASWWMEGDLCHVGYGWLLGLSRQVLCNCRIIPGCHSIESSGCHSTRLIVDVTQRDQATCLILRGLTPRIWCRPEPPRVGLSRNVAQPGGSGCHSTLLIVDVTLRDQVTRLILRELTHSKHVLDSKRTHSKNLVQAGASKGRIVPECCSTRGSGCHSTLLIVDVTLHAYPVHQSEKARGGFQAYPVNNSIQNH